MRSHCIVVASLLATVSCRARLEAQPIDPFEQLVVKHGLLYSAIGVTRSDKTIYCGIHPDALDFTHKSKRVLIIGGVDGSRESVQVAKGLLDSYYSSYAKNFPTVRVSIVPSANPDQLINKGADAKPIPSYPPSGAAYNSNTTAEAHYLWRWIGMHAPDLLVVVEFDADASKPMWSATENGRLAKAVKARTMDLPKGHLVRALASFKPSNTGTIPALRLRVSKADDADILTDAFKELVTSDVVSNARRELIARVNRTPLQVARQLSEVYGDNLNSVAYIPALALIGRVRVGELTGDAKQLADVERIVKPYVDGKATLPQRTSGSNLSGHLVFGDLAARTKNPRYIQLAKAAADLGFNADGSMKESMPAHSEMSDAVFMGCPILAQVGMLTGERKYFDMAVRHMRFMTKLNVRSDGLHQHSPLDEAAWGRGNGFPALGLALTLTEMPKEYIGHDEVLATYRKHIAALVKHQDPTGTWHQVIDKVESYREFTSTCMITFAIVRGIRKGWLDEAVHRPIVERAWRAIRTRIAADGSLVDVCTGTGKQKDLRAYYDRTAILGRDARGGAMALMVSTELATWHRERGEK